MIRYPEEYNPVLLYWEEIKSGRETVSRKIYKTYQKLAHDIEDPDSEWFFSCRRSNHILEFAENFCRHSKGELGGQLVKLELWEKALLGAVFGFINADGVRKYQRAVLIVAKKNGKSLIASIVANYMLFADSEAGPEIYAVATKRDQAKIIWEESKRMIRKSPILNQRARTLVAEIKCDKNDGVFKPVASDSDTLDGLNIHCVLMDEFHQWKNGHSLYDIMSRGITARRQPLIFMTSTAGTVREDIYDEIYTEGRNIIDGYFQPDGFTDERSIFFVYELDSREEWQQPDKWKKANPGLGTIKKIRTISEWVEKAKRDKNSLRDLLCKDFNLPETAFESWLTFDEAVNEALFDVGTLKPRYFIGGTDLSRCNDLTAAKAIFQLPADEKIYALSMYWIPEDCIDKKVHEDHVPYDKWIEKGYCRVSKGNKINYKDVTAWFREVRDVYDIYPLYIGYDAYSSQYWVDEMANEFGASVMKAVQQTSKVLSAPMTALGQDIKAKRVIYNNNPIDRWCLCNTAAKEDTNGNIKPIKTNKSTQRIDGFAALLDAYVILDQYGEEYRTML